MAIVESKTSPSGYRDSKNQRFAKAPLKAKAIGSIVRLPATLAGLAIGGPLISLAASGVSISAAVLNAGVMLTGVASRVAGGVMGAAGGLAGGGQSGNVKKDKGKQMQMVQAALNKKGPTGRDGGIADIKSTLADYDVPEGAMSMLPTGDEDGMGMLSGMLHQIAVNTSYLGGIDSKIDALVGLSTISVIDEAQETKGGEGGIKQEGAIKRTFNSLKDGLSSMSNSLGTAGKSILKGIGLVGAFIAFKKFEPQITAGLSSLFENVSGFFDSMTAGGDPSDSIVDYFDNMMENSILPALTTMAEKAFEVLFKAIKLGLNMFLGFPLFNPDALDDKSSSGMSTATSTPDQTSVQSMITSGQDLGSIRGLGFTGGIAKSIYFDDGLLGKYGGIGATGDFEPDSEEREIIMNALRDRLTFMYKHFMASNGRIRWTNIGKGFIRGMGIDSLNGNFDIAKIFASQPIVDSKVRANSALNIPYKELIPETFSSNPEKNKQIIGNLIDASRFKQESLLPGGFMNKYDANPSKALENLQMIQRAIKVLMNDGASLSNGQGEITAAIDASNNSQHMHETKVAGLTSAYHSDLNMVAFMGNNQVA